MGIVRNDNDQLPAEAVDARAKTYENMMNLGYLLGLPISLAIVMIVTLLMLGHGAIITVFIGLLTGLGVYTFVKLFLVH